MALPVGEACPPSATGMFTAHQPSDGTTMVLLYTRSRLDPSAASISHREPAGVVAVQQATANGAVRDAAAVDPRAAPHRAIPVDDVALHHGLGDDPVSAHEGIAIHV